MIATVFSADAQVIYQEADDDKIAEEAILVLVDACGTLVIRQRDSEIVIDRNTIPELVATLNKYRSKKPRGKK